MGLYRAKRVGKKLVLFSYGSDVGEGFRGSVPAE
jgi:hypothetical protein